MTTTLVRRHGDISLPAGGVITIGQLVAGASNAGEDQAVVAGAGALNVLGVAQTDATNVAPSATDVFPTPDRCSISSGGEYLVTYAAAATVGDKLKAAANGEVTPFLGTDTDPRLLVGYCTQTTAAGAQGRAYIG